MPPEATGEQQGSKEGQVKEAVACSFRTQQHGHSAFARMSGTPQVYKQQALPCVRIVLPRLQACAPLPTHRLSSLDCRT